MATQREMFEQVTSILVLFIDLMQLIYVVKQPMQQKILVL